MVDCNGIIIYNKVNAKDGRSREDWTIPMRSRLDPNARSSDTHASPSPRPGQESWGRGESDLVTEDEYHRGFRRVFSGLHLVKLSTRTAQEGLRAESRGRETSHPPSRADFLPRLAWMSSHPTFRPVGSAVARLRDPGRVRIGDASAVLQVLF
jgi:hypothetical protein